MMTPFAKAEDALEKEYNGKFVKYTPVGGPELYGRVDRIALDNTKNPWTVILIVDGRRYETDYDSFNTQIEFL